jgi:hypothetical protein
MGNQVSMPAARAAPFAPNLTHKQRVTRLYRHALRTARDWEPDFDEFVKDAEKIQARFKKNKHVSVPLNRIQFSYQHLRKVNYSRRSKTCRSRFERTYCK